MSCASVGWTLSYRFVRMLQMECDGEVCFPLDARASHELQLTVTRSPSARTMLTGTTDTSCIGLLDHVCLPVWLSLCIRSFASLDVAAHVARITIFAVAFRALVIVPLAVVFVLAAIPHLRSRAVNSVDEPAPSVRRKLQQAGTAGVIAVFVNVYSIPEPQPGGVGDALLWWLMDEVMMTLLLTGSVLYSPKLGWSHVNGVCTGLVSFPSAPHKAANCVPQYFFVSLGVAWVATQLLYFVVFAAVLHRRHRELGQLNRSESEASWHTRPIPRTQALNTVSTAIAAQSQMSSQHVIVIQSPPAGSLQAPALRRLEATAIAWLSGSTAASRVHTQVARAEGLTVISSGNSPMRIRVTIPPLPADTAAEHASKGSPQVPGQSLLSSTRRRQLPNYRGALSPKI